MLKFVFLNTSQPEVPEPPTTNPLTWVSWLAWEGKVNILKRWSFSPNSATTVQCHFIYLTWHYTFLLCWKWVYRPHKWDPEISSPVPNPLSLEVWIDCPNPHYASSLMLNTVCSSDPYCCDPAVDTELPLLLVPPWIILSFHSPLGQRTPLHPFPFCPDLMVPHNLIPGLLISKDLYGHTLKHPCCSKHIALRDR